MPPKLKVPAHSGPVKRWSFRKADWKRFCLLTDESAERLPPLDTSNIEMAYQDFCESLLSAAKQCIPRGHRKNCVQWHGRPQKFFQGGAKFCLFLPVFFRLMAMQRRWTYTKKRMFNVM